ncbi:uncharacterized protein LOC132750648 [Ruditapes philippinarum]|uniref:uncharacterized protein LOC132750648 n=1 Tax=Ruditapes philippinarum TaxID=129788 RepID=UPI00295BE204|nr:uncharacterized protein LOC132750648 [Ruditapes philippinarum]
MATNTFIHVSLNENDVPGAKFAYSMIEKHSNVQLRRWLYCRDLKTSGNKDDLVKRVKMCIEARRDGDISLNVDGGKWYDIKLEKLKQENPSQVNGSIPPITGWNIFPSVLLPKHFNQGHIHHHIVESVQFIGQIESTGTENCENDIEDLHTSKPLKKGLEYFRSGHVQAMQDCIKGDSYFIKAKVMASYTIDTDYSVLVQISKVSGFVKDASCTCPASAMGRCAHVTGLLYALNDYIDKFGCEPLSCTSKQCGWNTGRKKKRNPQNIFKAEYPSLKKKKVDSIIDFDPTPLFPQRSPLQTLSDFLGHIESGNESKCMWETVLFREYEDYALNLNEEQNLKENVAAMIDSLNVDRLSEHISKQGSEEWFSERRIRVTASESKRISCAKSESVVYNILKIKLWGQGSQTKSMCYGVENEGNAFDNYVRYASESNSEICVKKTGFWVNPNFPQLGASPDGLINHCNNEYADGLLEIKCPAILQNKLVQNYETVLSKSQLKNFCIYNQDGKNALKDNHAYYYQIQAQLGILERNWCDLFIWGGEDNFLVVRVQFNPEFWSNLKEKMIQFHSHWLAPEYFEMRIPRRLLPKYL